MDYEKLYKEALERARKGQNIESIFPELNESKDDRIKRELLEYLDERRVIERLTDTRVKDEWLSWLEKQGKNDMGISEATKKKLEDDLNGALEKETPESWNKFLENQGEQVLINNDKYQTVPVKILNRLYKSEKELEQLKQCEQILKCIPKEVLEAELERRNTSSDEESDIVENDEYYTLP